MCGYGPQEYDGKDRKDKFWEYLNTEVNNACTNGAGIVIQMDGNFWAGSDLVAGDPKPHNQNGKRFTDFLQVKIKISLLSMQQNYVKESAQE